MNNSRDNDQFLSSFRAKLQASQVDAGLTLAQLREQLNLESAQVLKEYFQGHLAMPVTVLNRYAQIVKKPIWWFFGDEPSTITLDKAENAMANISRVRLYLDAVESEFKTILAPSAEMKPKLSAIETNSGDGNAPVVVDFAPYLSRARVILEREAEFSEDSEEVFEESLEMMAHSLYSIETAQSPSREFMVAVRNSRDSE